jgi:hypothetical protein
VIVSRDQEGLFRATVALIYPSSGDHRVLSNRRIGVSASGSIR